jgi:hydrogenase maturation protease
MNRIICIGNRFVAADAAGPAVFDRLAARDLPADVELIDGGLGGLSLMRWFDGAEKIVFVDSVHGFGRPGEVLALDASAIAARADAADAHGAGLPYLLRAAPLVGGLPPIHIVGIEGASTAAAIEQAAAAALAAAGGEP